MTRMDRRSFLRNIGSAAVGLAAASWATRASALSAHAPAKRPLNFVFFLIDDLGWADTGCYGSTFYETPRIDALASQGIRFTNAYAACPVCSPTRASVMTGKYPARLHLTNWIPGDILPKAKLKSPGFLQQLPLEEVTIAEVLKPAGYTCASVGKWHLGGAPFYPERQGFDLNFAGDHRGHPPAYFYPYNIPGIPEGEDGEYLTDRLTGEAVRFLENNKDKPFFLYFPHYAVHMPLEAKQQMIEKYKAKVKPGEGQNNPIYAAMIQSVDESVGRILDTLDKLGLADNTAVFFMSDNGGLARVTSNAPLRAGKGTLYEGGIREPFIVRWPGVVKPGSVCDAPVISNDFLPTIRAMAGVEANVKDLDGVDLVPLLKGKRAPKRDALYWHYPHYHPGGATPGGVVRHGDYKLIEFYEDGRVELYNLETDPGEQTDLAPAMPKKANQLRHMLHQWLKQVDAQMPTPNPNYDPANPTARK